MRDLPKSKLILATILIIFTFGLIGCKGETASPTAEVSGNDHDGTEGPPPGAVRSVKLLEYWVNAGAPESEEFSYTGADGNEYKGTFDVDILPLFNKPRVWFDKSHPCSACHFGNMETSYHELDLTSYSGIMSGADPISNPPGEPLLGESEIGSNDFVWNNSELKVRLRNNRMPPGWVFDLTETNRDGPCLKISEDGVTIGLKSDDSYEYGCDLKAVDLIGAWVSAGAPEEDPFDYMGNSLTFERDVLSFFTKPGMWFEDSQPCITCHFANTEASYHEMDLSSYSGIMSGGDVLSEPPGVPLLGQSEVGADDFNWNDSKMHARLRDNRMPPGWEFDITEENRNGPYVLHGEIVEP